MKENKETKSKGKIKRLKKSIRNSISSQEVYATWGVGMNGKKLCSEKE